MMSLMRGKGFTLVEIMIVVGIIALLAAIAIPNFLRARIDANESAAISNLRTISTSCEIFRTVQTPPAYPASLNTLTVVSNPPYIDPSLDDAAGPPERQGYTFTYVQDTVHQYHCDAAPINPDVTGIRLFTVDEDGVVRLGTDVAPGAPVE